MERFGGHPAVAEAGSTAGGGRAGGWRLGLVAAALVVLVLPATGLAQRYTAGPFIFNVLSQGQQFYQHGGYVTTARDFSSLEMQSVLSAANYWVERVGGDRLAALLITLAKIDNPSGTAYSFTPDTGRSDSDVYYYLTSGTYYSPLPLYGYNTLVVFESEYSPISTRLLMQDDSITSTITHEMMHALGMGGCLDPADESVAWNATNWTLSLAHDESWASHLYDIKGNQATEGVLAFNAATPGDRSGGDFVLPQFNADPTAFVAGQVSFFPTFHGTAVDELTNGKGMPVMAGNGDDYAIDGGNVLAHPALLGSIMSYSPIRNMLFTELELAVLKDMGYDIDLNRFFGKSYYPTNLGGELTQDPDFAAGKGAYLAETPLTVTNTDGFDSDASYGVGLHVYRDWLTVTQDADITASGYGAGGIRIDGTNNTVTVPDGITVAANGSYGTGILVSYGKNNVINLDGTVEAVGNMGIGAHFGLGGMAYSYYEMADPDTLVNSDNRYFCTKMNSDLNGPLVSSFNISGNLRGSLAAIKIDADALVRTINVRSGATITGDILSAWNPATYSLVGDQYYTDLNFGGSSTAGDTDSDFGMVYYGNITGPDGMNMYVRAGTLSFNGTAYVRKAGVDAGATLKGNSTIALSLLTEPFYNAGTIAPGNSIGVINIVGDFLNTGNLFMEFNGSGMSDILNVSGAFTHNGTVTVMPVADYYSGTMFIPLSGMFSSSSGALPTVIDTFVPAQSPTIVTFMSGGPTYTMTTIRAAGAYSRYARSANASRVGGALAGLGDFAVGDTRTLFTALDFSALDGSGVASALEQLSPQAYSSAVQASTDAERTLSAIVLRGMMSRSGRPVQNDAGGGREVFVEMYGDTRSQQAGGDAIGYSASAGGVLGGFEHRFDETGLTAGVHAALGYRQADMFVGPGAKSTTRHLHVGGHALMRPEDWNGAYLFGMARVGIENNKMKRSILFDDYSRTSRADWLGFAGAASLGGGYERRVGPVVFGPIASLEYTCIGHPRITEYDGAGTRLTLDAATYHSLRSGLGARVGMEHAFGAGKGLNAGVGAQWKHELLDPETTVRAVFTGYDAWTFDTKRSSAVDSLMVQGDLALALDTDFNLSLYAGTELFRAGYTSLHGGLSARWSF